MVWLLTQIWAALAAAAFIGLLLGSSIRGLMLRGRVRRATVERDITRTELEQAQMEIEGLYAAQRKRAAEPTAPVAETPAPAVSETAVDERALRGELSTAQAALHAKELELTELKAALDTARRHNQITPAAAVGAVAKAAEETPGDSDTTLTWRNRYLESRVRMLEAKINDMAESAPPVALSSAPEPTVEAAPAVAETSSDDSMPVQEVAKLVWQNEYLRQRVTTLEAGAISAASARAAAPPAVSEPAPAEPSADLEESAKLRWRNRYLEGRVAYHEGDESEDAATPLIEAQTDEDAAAEPAEVIHPSEAAFNAIELEHVERLAPERAEKPRGGDGDDLKTIDGVGPKIEEVLKHELGVYHLSQIAGWTPENIAWVDDHFHFDGRILRENWVEQAKALISTQA